MWKIKHIFDGEYGCEELAEGQRPKVSVTEHGLNEGDLWPKEDEFL